MRNTKPLNLKMTEAGKVSHFQASSKTNVFEFGSFKVNRRTSRMLLDVSLFVVEVNYAWPIATPWGEKFSEKQKDNEN